jgi:hypothetical protein
MADLDVAEMFLNFNLHPQLQELCGVDLTHYGEPRVKGDAPVHERWLRAAMGLRSLPYQAVQAMTYAEEMILGDRQNEANPFRWECVWMNLPVQSNYDPSLPWVSKVRQGHAVGDRKVIASDVFIYVDDVRITGPSDNNNN